MSALAIEATGSTRLFQGRQDPSRHSSGSFTFPARHSFDSFLSRFRDIYIIHASTCPLAPYRMLSRSVAQGYCIFARRACRTQNGTAVAIIAKRYAVTSSPPRSLEYLRFSAIVSHRLFGNLQPARRDVTGSTPPPPPRIYPSKKRASLWLRCCRARGPSGRILRGPAVLFSESL
jgi:hypothetical protein